MYIGCFYQPFIVGRPTSNNNLPLFINGSPTSNPNNNSLPLFIGGVDVRLINSNTTLYTIGYTITDISNNVPLVTLGQIPNTNTLPLLINGQIGNISNSNSIPLSIYSNVSTNNNVPLNIIGQIGSGGNSNSLPLFLDAGNLPNTLNNNVTLYINSKLSSNDNLPLIIGGQIGNGSNTNSLPLYIKAPNPTVGINSNKTLFIDGDISINQQIPLFLKTYVPGTPKNEGMNLFLKQFTAPTGPSFNHNLNLFIMNGSRINNNNNPLYIYINGGNVPNSTISLTITGGTWTKIFNTNPLYIATRNVRNEKMNLFLKCDSIPLFFNTNPLYIRGTANGSIGIGTQHEPMNLFIRGISSGKFNKMLHLWIGGSGSIINPVIPPVVNNPNNFLEDPHTTLFIKGLGGTPGSLPVGHSLGLFLECGPIDNTNYYKNTYNINNNMPLYITNIPIQLENIANNLPILINGSGGNINNNLVLFINGDFYKIINSSTTLAIPHVNNLLPNTCFLYVNGFEY